MCGIVYAKSLNGKDMTTTVLNRFESQRERGTTSFGYYLPAKDKLVHNIKEQRIKTLLRRTKGENQEIMFHHRKSTSTDDVRNACHPFSTKDAYDHEYIGIHNGVVRNPTELKTMHQKEGIEYVSNQPPTSNAGYVRFNDSEALVYDLAAYFEGKVKKLTAYGTIAFVVMRLGADGKPDKLYFGHNSGNPLVMKRNKKTLQVSSTGDGKPVPTDILHVYDYATNQIHTEAMEIPSVSTFRQTSSYTNKGEHKYDFNPEATFEQRTTDFYKFNRWDTYTQKWVPDYEGRKGFSWDKKQQKYVFVSTIVRGHAKNEEPDEEDAKNIPTEQDIKEALELREQLAEELEKEEHREAGKTPRDLEHGFVRGHFTLRGSSKKEIRDSILVTSRGLNGALDACRKEILGCISAINDIDDRLMNKEIPTDQFQTEFDFWDELQTYKEVLVEIAAELKAELQKRTDKEDAGARTFGFQIPERTLTADQQKLV